MNRTMPPDTSTADLVQELGLDKHVRVAIIDSDQCERERLARTIRRCDLFEYEIEGFDGAADGLAALTAGEFHLAFVDFCTDPAKGLDIVRNARSHALETPIVIMSGPGQRRLDIQVLRDGGADVVVKDELLQTSVLERIIRHTLLRTRQARELRRRASYDDLTGLANRTFFRAELERCVARAGCDESEVSVVYVDLDGFKTINDRFGHLTGDAVLHEVANRLHCAVGDFGLVARLGGDEFAVVLEGGAEQAKLVERCIHRCLEVPIHHEGRDVQTAASVGSAVYPEDGVTPDRLVDHADRMMYGAKQRSATARAGVTPERWWRRLQRLVDDFPRALENDELHLVFQPQLDEIGGRVRSVEVLTRWDHPSLGPVSPAEFIPAIERCGLSYELDSWVIRTALKTRRGWASKGLAVPKLSINVSAKSLVKPSLLKMVTSGLEQTGQSPNDIEIELTETAVLDAQAAPVMQALRKSGIALAIDDFGVGQSSLASLAHTPATVLKLDRTLLMGAALDPRHEKVLRWAIRLGRDLGMEVVAEGIEAESQLDLLRQESVDGYQGFLFARPLGEEALLEWFTSSARRAGSTRRSGRVGPSIPPSSDPRTRPLNVLPHLPC